MKLWHVTFASRLPAILREGIVQAPARSVGAFADHGDAMCWASKLQWDLSNSHDNPRLVVIVEFDGDPDAWEEEPTRPRDVPRSSMVLRHARVPPTAIRHADVLVSALLSR